MDEKECLQEVRFLESLARNWFVKNALAIIFIGGMTSFFVVAILVAISRYFIWVAFVLAFAFGFLAGMYYLVNKVYVALTGHSYMELGESDAENATVTDFLIEFEERNKR